MRKLTITTIISALSLALLVSACGGGGDGDTTASLTKAQFTKQAEAICEKANTRQLEQMQRVATALPGNKQFGELSEQRQASLAVSAGMPALQRSSEEISKLGAPSGDEAEVAAIVEEREKAIKTFENDPLNTLETAFVIAKGLAAKYGLKACSEVP